MISFKSFDFNIVESVASNDSRHYFDLDDTLFHHDNSKLRVHVHDQSNRRVRTLTSSEFNRHQLPPGHAYDFSEFRSSRIFGESSKPIRKMIAKLKGIHKNGGKAEILTARSDFDDKDAFAHHMKKYGIDPGQIHVRRAGNMVGMRSPQAKAAIVSQAIQENGLKKVHLYDDHPDNLSEFLKLKSKHPDVEFHAHHVEHDPETGNVNITTTSVIPKDKKNV